MDYNLKQILRFRITIQTIKDTWKTTLIFTLLFSGMAAMYSGMYPQFKEFIADLGNNPDAMNLFLSLGNGNGDITSYVGFLNLEMYSIFFILILGIIIAFIAASIISKEIESKTIDLLMSNPVSRKQIVFERFIGLIPMVLIINFVSMIVIMGTTIAINESLDFYYLFLTHLSSIPYFLAVIALSLLISTIFDEKMKSSIIMIAIIVGMFFLNFIGNMVNIKEISFVSLTHYFNSYTTLKFGQVDLSNVIILLAVASTCLVIAMIYFEHKDIKV
jgi:ABC-2 type transport system permease protein